MGTEEKNPGIFLQQKNNNYNVEAISTQRSLLCKSSSVVALLSHQLPADENENNEQKSQCILRISLN